MKQLSRKPLEFQGPLDEIEVLELEIPKWLFTDLCEIQAAQGRPLGSLIVKQLENFVIDNWDLSSDSPRKEKWSEQ